MSVEEGSECQHGDRRLWPGLGVGAVEMEKATVSITLRVHLSELTELSEA